MNTNGMKQMREMGGLTSGRFYVEPGMQTMHVGGETKDSPCVTGGDPHPSVRPRPQWNALLHLGLQEQAARVFAPRKHLRADVVADLDRVITAAATEAGRLDLLDELIGRSGLYNEQLVVGLDVPVQEAFDPARAHEWLTSRPRPFLPVDAVRVLAADDNPHRELKRRRDEADREAARRLEEERSAEEGRAKAAELARTVHERSMRWARVGSGARAALRAATKFELGTFERSVLEALAEAAALEHAGGNREPPAGLDELLTRLAPEGKRA